MTETGLALRNESTTIRSFADVQNVASAMAKSGFFTDSQNASQAIVKILAGQEIGFGPVASMMGIHIIKGKPGIGANLMASAVKGSGKYDYRVIELTDKACELDFFERVKGEFVKVGTSRFTIEDAKRAGTQNLDKFPRNMLFARAMSNGVKWYVPDAFNGATVYTPEELGATVDGEGNVIDSNFKEVTPLADSKPEQPAAPKPTVQDDQPAKEYGAMTYEQACAIKGSKGELYGNLTDLELKGKRFGITKIANDANTDPAKQSAALNKLEAIKILLAVPEAERLQRAGQPMMDL